MKIIMSESLSGDSARGELGDKSSLEVEPFFTDDVLESLNHLKEESIAGSSAKVKKFAGKKALFWEKLFDLPSQDFENFKLLFKKIEELLN